MLHLFLICYKSVCEDLTHWCKYKEEQSFSIWNLQKLHITSWPYKSRPPHKVHQKCALTQIKLTCKDAGEYCSGAEEKEREVHFRRLLRRTALTALVLLLGEGPPLAYIFPSNYTWWKENMMTQQEVDTKVTWNSCPPMKNLLSRPHQ